jgi:cell division protein FtsL
VVFFSATVWAGVIAAQRPITCQNRQLQPERYVQVLQEKIYNNEYRKIIYSINFGYFIIYGILIYCKNRQKM